MRGRKIIKGVFCDIGNTLMDMSGNIDYEVLGMLKEYEKQGKKIHLWTGGDTWNVKRKIPEELRNKWIILSKRDFLNENMEIIIDDEPKEELFLFYGITGEEYINIIPEILRKFL